MVQNLCQLNEQMIIIQNTFNKPVAVMSIATTFTVTASLTGLLSTKNTSSEPPLSVTSRASPDPSSDSKETTAIGIMKKIHCDIVRVSSSVANKLQ